MVVPGRHPVGGVDGPVANPYFLETPTEGPHTFPPAVQIFSSILLDAIRRNSKLSSVILLMKSGCESRIMNK